MYKNISVSESKVWNTALYARLSREDGDKEESDSIVNQRKLIRSFIESKPDLILTREYEDDGYSGVNYERPSIKRMFNDIKDGIINCVIVKDLSRFGRNYIETGKYLERLFPFMGVRFIAINDNYDNQNHNIQTDNLLIPFRNLMNEAFLADISRKVRSQFEQKRKNGDYIGSFTAYGYKKDPDNKNRLIIDETAALTVRDIFKWKIQGMSQQGISDKLNELGVLSPLELKKANGSNYTTVFNTKHFALWTPVAIGRILKNELYIGTLIQGISTTPNYKVKQRFKKSEEDWVRTEQSHEPIISIENFNLVKELLCKDTRIAPGNDNVYVFSGILLCADCGLNMVRKYMYVKNVKYLYYVCSTNKKGEGCKSHIISDNNLNSAILETLQHHIHDCIKINHVLEFIDSMPLHEYEAKKLKKMIDDKYSEIEKLNKRCLNLSEDFSDRIISQSDYIKFNNVFTTQIADATKAYEKLQEEYDNIINNKVENRSWIEHFKKYHDIQSLTRNVVVELINHITIFEGGKIEVDFRYKSNFENALNCIESLSDNERLVI